MSSADAPRTGRLKLLFFGALVVAAALTGIGILFAGDQRSDVALEAATAGIQLGAITLIGAAVAQGLRQFNEARAERLKQADVEREERLKQADVEREERRRLNEYRMAVFRDTVDAYNSVKTVRRALRAAGLTPPIQGSLRPDQMVEFNAQMRVLNDAELSLEKIEREVGAQKETFANAWAQIGGLKASSKYLRRVLNAWETGTLLATDRTGPEEESLKNLENFLVKRREALAKRRETGGDVFWGSFNAFEKAIRADLIQVPAPPLEGPGGRQALTHRSSADGTSAPLGA